MAYRGAQHLAGLLRDQRIEFSSSPDLDAAFAAMPRLLDGERERALINLDQIEKLVEQLGDVNLGRDLVRARNQIIQKEQLEDVV